MWLSVVRLDGALLEDSVKAVLLGNLCGGGLVLFFHTLGRIDVTLLGNSYSNN